MFSTAHTQNTFLYQNTTLAYCTAQIILWNPWFTERPCRDRVLRGLRFITVALLRGAGDWEGTANTTVSSRWPRMKVMSLSEMNRASYPRGPPGLFLKSYITSYIGCSQAVLHLIQSWSLLLRSCIFCESSHAYINCFYILSTCFRMWQWHKAQFQLHPWQL